MSEAHAPTGASPRRQTPGIPPDTSNIQKQISRMSEVWHEWGIEAKDRSVTRSGTPVLERN